MKSKTSKSYRSLPWVAIAASVLSVLGLTTMPNVHMAVHAIETKAKVVTKKTVTGVSEPDPLVDGRKPAHTNKEDDSNVAASKSTDTNQDRLNFKINNKKINKKEEVQLAGAVVAQGEEVAEGTKPVHTNKEDGSNVAASKSTDTNQDRLNFKKNNKKINKKEEVQLAGAVVAQGEEVVEGAKPAHINKEDGSNVAASKSTDTNQDDLNFKKNNKKINKKEEVQSNGVVGTAQGVSKLRGFAKFLRWKNKEPIVPEDQEGDTEGGAAAAPVDLEGMNAGDALKPLGSPGALKKVSGLFKSDRKNSVTTDTVVLSDAMERVQLRGAEKDAEKMYLDKRESYATKAASIGLKKIHQDFDRKGLTGPKDEKLPSEEELKEIFAQIYDAQDEDRNITHVGTTDAMMSMTDRLEGNVHTTSFQDASIVYDMFAEVLKEMTDTWYIRMNATDQEGLLNLTPLNMTENDLEHVAALCTDPKFSSRLVTLNYNPEDFCPAFQLLLPLRVPTLPVELQSDLAYLSGYLADDLFITAGEPECYHRMEEIILRNGVASGKETPFPAAASTSTFDQTFLSVCYSHRAPFNPDQTFCERALKKVHEINNRFESENVTNVEFISDMCDTLGLHLPHPNTTISLRFASPHVDHKPGGKHKKIRHMVADLFNYAGHYKHGFMDKNGEYIQHESDFLLDPVDEELLQTSADVNTAQRNTYCSGVSYSVGGGVSAEMGPLSIGGGVDFGFGNLDRERTNYAEAWVWGVCGLGDSVNIHDADDAAAAKKDSKDQSSVPSFGIEASVGFWFSVGDIPGTSRTYELSFQYLIIQGSISVIDITHDGNDGAGWSHSKGPGGFVFSVGLSSSKGKSIDFSDADCYGAVIPGTQKTWNVPNGIESCGAVKHSLDFSPVSSGDSADGITVWYWKNKSDWHYGTNRKMIDTWCGTPWRNNWFYTNDFYAVGMVSHGTDAYNVATIKVTRQQSLTTWIDVMVHDSKVADQLWSVSNDPNDNGGSKYEWEWKKDGGTYHSRGLGAGWRLDGMWHFNVMVDVWANVGWEGELTDNDIKFSQNGREIEILRGTKHYNHKTSGQIDVGGTGGFDGDKLLKEFRIDTTSSGFRNKHDLFVIDRVRAEYWDRHHNKCTGLVDIKYTSSNYQWFGGDNSVGWCLIYNVGGCWDVPKKHCYTSKVGDYWYFDGTTGSNGFYGSWRSSDGWKCKHPGKQRFHETWPECNWNEFDMDSSKDNVLDYDTERGLIPRNEIVSAILGGSQDVSVDIFGDGRLHKVLLSNAEIHTEYADVSDEGLALAFQISGAVFEEEPEVKFRITCGDASEDQNCEVTLVPNDATPETSSPPKPPPNPTMSPVACNTNADSDDIPPSCKDLDYDVALYAIENPHFSLVATLNEVASATATALDCPEIIAFNSLSGEKKIHFVDESLAQDIPHHKFGAAKLGSILKAEEKAKPIQDSEFDIATNNCVHFAASIWRQLGFKEDAELAQFLIENIVGDGHTHNFLDGLHSTASSRRALAAHALGTDALTDYFADVVYSELNIQK